MTRDEYQQRRVGLQLLTNIAVPIAISKLGASKIDPAILLSVAPDSNGEVGIIMREGAYNPRDSLNMTVNGKAFLLIPTRMVEGGEDFDWAMYKAMVPGG